MMAALRPALPPPITSTSKAVRSSPRVTISSLDPEVGFVGLVLLVDACIQ